mmetsp:Transcript_5911/g.17123  ORF Transcript_5911/g.17123 Transcript_5911/m.17123 type:complete len:249 (+) Transcript_5911:242-988(+)
MGLFSKQVQHSNWCTTVGSAVDARGHLRRALLRRLAHHAAELLIAHLTIPVHVGMAQQFQGLFHVNPDVVLGSPQRLRKLGGVYLAVAVLVQAAEGLPAQVLSVRLQHPVHDHRQELGVVNLLAAIDVERVEDALQLLRIMEAHRSEARLEVLETQGASPLHIHLLKRSAQAADARVLCVSRHQPECVLLEAVVLAEPLKVADQVLHRHLHVATRRLVVQAGLVVNSLRAGILHLGMQGICSRHALSR